MRVKVLFFGMLKDVAGRPSDAVELRAGSTVGELLGHYERQFPALKPLLPSVAVSLNQEYTGPEAELHANDEVGLLPPVSGGGASERVGISRASIVRERIEMQAVLERIKKPDDGAAVVFDGIVRNNTRGRQTLYLDYEAYEEMAMKQMEGLASEAMGKFGVRDVALVHRLGRLEIGETSVLIVVASAHRAAAFEACRWLIDTLKKTVPIWKKEFFVDGAVWADGEPFPAEIPRAEGSPSVGTASK
jgi:molybdopterin synthase catalytic subunit/molybdopterin converting factor small subunit